VSGCSEVVNGRGHDVKGGFRDLKIEHLIVN
jgi:hypothetical protein